MSGLIPGDQFVRCVKVTYSGSVNPSAVHVYATAPSGALGDHLDFTVEEGDGGTAADCTGFTATSTLFDATVPAASAGTLAAFAARTTYATGLAGWTPSVAVPAKTYRLTAQVRDEDTGAGTSTALGLTWEVRS